MRGLELEKVPYVELLAVHSVLGDAATAHEPCGDEQNLAKAPFQGPLRSPHPILVFIHPFFQQVTIFNISYVTRTSAGRRDQDRLGLCFHGVYLAEGRGRKDTK